jgi:hypothetical protein
MAVTITQTQITITDAAGAAVNLSANGTGIYTPGSNLSFALQSTAGLQRWALKFICPAFPSLHLQEIEWLQGQANLKVVAMPPGPSSQANNVQNSIFVVSECADGFGGINQSVYYLQSAGAAVVPTSRSVRCIVNLGTNGLGGAGYTNVNGVLTETANGAWTNSNSDSVAIAVGDRVLAVGAGVNNFDNGVYQVTSLGSAGSPWVLTRAPDMGQGVVLPAGSTAEVSEGTRYANSTWKDVLAGAKTIGTTNMAAAYFPKSINGAIALSGGAITVSNLHVASPLGSTAPGPGVTCSALDFTAANAVKAVLTAGNGNGSIALTGTATDVIQYSITNW